MNKFDNLKTKIKTQLEKYNAKYSTLEFEYEEYVKKGRIKKIEHQNPGNLHLCKEILSLLIVTLLFQKSSNSISTT